MSKSNPILANSVICCTMPAPGGASCRRLGISSKRGLAVTSGRVVLGKTETQGMDDAEFWCSNSSSSNVQVTLQIVKALIEKTPRDLPLYAAAILRIFKSILRSLDVTMIESTVPTFATFCAHQDPAVLAADQSYFRQYEEVVQAYAAFASKLYPVQHKSAKSVPVRIRFRKAGLAAIKAIAESDSIVAETSTQLALIIPPILESVYASDGQYLLLLEHREEEKVEFEREIAIKRRQSTSTVRTTDPSQADQLAASGTTEAADKLAEQETGVIALQALKKVFSTVPRGQLRLATAEVLKFIAERVHSSDHFPEGTVIPMYTGSWPCTLFNIICSWAAVQDRYTILLTAVEALIKSPLREESLEKQFVVASIVGWLLSSNINFIGLSIMDVLVGLVQHILALLQNSVQATGSPRLKAMDEEPENETEKVESAESPTTEMPPKPDHSEAFHRMSPARSRLLAQLQRCVGCLAVHVYYSDQISDMITAIISRLKPTSQVVAIPSSASTIENGHIPADNTGSSSSLAEKPSGDGFYSFESARVAALTSIREILIWANWTKDTSSNSTPRSAVSVEKWEGTQWLLRDHSWKVRTAYVDVLLVWMHLEVKQKDLTMREELPRKSSKKEKTDGPQKEASLARRAVSNASQREKSPRRTKDTFLQLLHLAAYDNAHQFATSESDILLLHLLLTQLAAKLGANSVQHGLPMIMRLQEDIFEIEMPKAQINVGSLVHGYLWAVSVYFTFDASDTGREIALEVSRRRNHGIWLGDIRVPSLPLEEIMQRRRSTDTDCPSPNALESEELQPFDRIRVFVDKIAEGYAAALYSPPNSPPSSPSRKLSTPLIDQSSYAWPMKKPTKLTQEVKNTLLSDWSREAIIVATTKHDGSRSGSVSGSPTATGLGRHLTVGVPGPGGIDDGQPSPKRSHHGGHNAHHIHSPFRTSRPSSTIHGGRDLYHPHALREAFHFNGAAGSRSRLGSQSGSPRTAPSSVRGSVRVEDLKRVLNGALPPLSTAGSGANVATNRQVPPEDDSASDSMMSYEGSEVSYAPQGTPTKALQPTSPPGEAENQGLKPPMDETRNVVATEVSETSRPATSASQATLRQPLVARKSSFTEVLDDEGIPPVPPLPSALQHQTPMSSSHTSSPPVANPVPIHTSPKSVASKIQQPKTRASSVRSVRESLRRSISTRDGVPQQGAADSHGRTSWNVLELLDDIDTDGPGAPPGSLSKGLGNGIKPPY
jgi:hypothetical protein